MRLSRLIEGCGTICAPSRDVEITDVVTSTEEVSAGSLFIALRGASHDGADYVPEALGRGAAAAVSERAGRNTVVVRDAHHASAVIFSNFYGDPSQDMKIVAVTGTNGKTTTVSAAAHILRAAGRRVGTLGTVEFTAGDEKIDREEFFPRTSSSMTTPDVKSFYRALALMRERGCDTALIEASSHALGRRRLDGLNVALGVFTNLSPEHLDSHGDMESYFAAKRSLAALSQSFLANCDDPYGRRLFREFDGAYGTSVNVDGSTEELFAAARNVRRRKGGGVAYDLVSQRGSAMVESPMYGSFAVYNTLCAVSVAMILGVGCADAASYVRSFRGAKGRMEKVFGEEGTPAAVIDYAHTPDALEKALKNVRAECRGRLILVFGCGGDRDRTKRAPMGRIAGSCADFSFVTEDNSRTEKTEDIIREIIKGFKEDNYEVVPDRREAILRAVDAAREGDVILCCGKGHEKYIIDNCGKRFFDEEAILRGALAEKYGTEQ